MAKKPVKFVWYDLMTSDIKSAEAFYHSVLGWSVSDSGLSDRTYKILSAGSTMVGGLMPIPDHAEGASPAWMGYLGVDDVDAYAKRMSDAGGAIHRGPEEIPGIGRFAVVDDPEGATLALYKGNSPEEPEDPPEGATGHVGWRELRAGNGPRAFAYYCDLFGWSAGEAIDMGSMGKYQIFAVGATAAGAIMTKLAETPVPGWLYYFEVDGVEAATSRVKQAGGKVVVGPHQVPGGSWIAHCLDPQGAKFGLLSANN